MIINKSREIKPFLLTTTKTMTTQTTGETPTTDRKADILQEIKKILRENCEIEIDLDDLDGINDTDDLYSEHVERAINEQTDIIYYSRAIEFLSKNDPSLRDSLEIAGEFGYKPEDLDSEKLASLLNYKLTLDTFWTFSSDLDALIDERHEIDDEEDYYKNN